MRELSDFSKPTFCAEKQTINTQYFEHAGQIPLQKWYEKDITALLLDKDNTLTNNGSAKCKTKVLEGLLSQIYDAQKMEWAIVSNNFNYTQIEESARVLLNQLELQRVICIAAAGKPDPAIGRALLEHLQLEPEQVAVIDDQLSGLEFAHRLGAGAVAICHAEGFKGICSRKVHVLGEQAVKIIHRGREKNSPMWREICKPLMD